MAEKTKTFTMTAKLITRDSWFYAALEEIDTAAGAIVTKASYKA